MPAGRNKRGRLSSFAALAALGLAVVIYIGVSLFGINMPVLWGHYGYHYGEYVLRARVALRFHTFIPAHWGGATFPPVSTYYLHHPILPSLLLAAAFFVFGEQYFLVRAIPAVWGLITLVIVWRLARRGFGDYPAAAAAIVYATLPFTAAFSALYDPGHLAALGFLFAMDAWLRYLERPGRRPALAAILGIALCGLSEWTPYLYCVFFLPIAFLLPWLGGKRGGPRRLGLWPSQWLAILMGLALVLALASHFGFTYAVGNLDDLLASYRGRSQTVPAATTITIQERYLGLYFGKPLYIVAALWGAAVLLRLALRRGRAADLVPFSMLAGWFVYVNIFPNAVNIHSYRSMPLVGFMALAVASLVEGAPAAARWVLSRVPPLVLMARPVAAAVGLGGFVLLLSAQAPHALHALVIAREKAGNEEYPGYDPQIRQYFFAASVRDRIPRDAVVFAHRHLGVRAEFVGLIDKEVADLPSLLHVERRRPQRRVFVAWDQDRLTAAERNVASALVAAHGILLIDRYALVDLTQARPEAEVYRIELGRPSLLYKYFVSHKYPPMRLREGIRPADSLWLGSLGLRLITKDDVARP
jgi:hypothetical protein